MGCNNSCYFVRNRSPGDNQCMSDFRRCAVGCVMYGRLQIHFEKRLDMKKLLSVLLIFCLVLLPACSSGSSKPDQTATAGTLTFTVPGEYRINEYDIITEVTTKKFTKEVLLFNVSHEQEASLEAANGTIQKSLEAYRKILVLQLFLYC